MAISDPAFSTFCRYLLALALAYRIVTRLVIGNESTHHYRTHELGLHGRATEPVSDRIARGSLAPYNANYLYDTEGIGC
jgi:hypothetical protein